MKNKYARIFQVFIILVFLFGSVNLNTVLAQDETPVPTEAVAIVEEVTTEPATATEVPATEIITATPTTIPTELPSEEATTKPDFVDVVQALSDLNIVIADENGNPMPLASQQTEDAISSSDPLFWDGSQWVGYVKTGGSCPVGVDVCNKVANPFQAAVDAAPANSTIYVSGSAVAATDSTNYNTYSGYYNEDVDVGGNNLSFVGFSAITLGTGIPTSLTTGYAYVKSLTLLNPFGTTTNVFGNKIILSSANIGFLPDALSLLNTVNEDASVQIECEQKGDIFVLGECRDKNEKMTICHYAGLEGSDKFQELELPISAIFSNANGVGGHFNIDGSPSAGHEDDHLGPCPTVNETPSNTPTATATPLITPTETATSTPIPTTVATLPPLEIPVTGGTPPALVIPVTGGQIIPVTGAPLIVAGLGHTCMTYGSGVVCWGLDSSGQLGDGHNVNQPIPVYVKSPSGDGKLSGIVNLTAGSIHTCALNNKNEVYCWGDNGSGQLGNGTSTNSSLPVLVKGLPADKVVALTAGEEFTCVQLSNQEVWCWGENGDGQLNDGSTTNRTSPVKSKLTSKINDFSGGQSNLLGSDLLSLDVYRNTQVAKVSEVNGPLSISANRWGETGCAIASNGVVKCWDSDLVSSVVKDAVNGLQVGAGMNHNCVINNNLTVSCWGENTQGALGDGSNTNSQSAVLVKNLTRANNIAVGANHTCVLQGITNVAVCWGDNTYGQLGINSTIASNVPMWVYPPIEN
jgi:hypothetical protein